MSNQTIVKNEDQYVDVLSDLGKTSALVNDSLLSTKDKEALATKEQEIRDFFTNTPKTDETFLKAVDLWNEYKDAVKNAICAFTINGIEIKVIFNKLHTAVEYDTETLFYGLHLKKHFVDSLPKVKSEFEVVESEISFSNAIALYHVLSTLKVKGLNKENYALAHVLYKLSEISKVYQTYDTKSADLNNLLRQWNAGLLQSEAEVLNQEISKTVIEESKAEVIN